MQSITYKKPFNTWLKAPNLRRGEVGAVEWNKMPLWLTVYGRQRGHMIQSTNTLNTHSHYSKYFEAITKESFDTCLV